MGLLYGFLGLEDRGSPLYGRACDEVVVERFSREKSIEFLEAGFAEAGVKVRAQRTCTPESTMML